MECFAQSTSECDTSKFFSVDAEVDRQTLQLRCGINSPITEDSKICLKHHRTFITHYTSRIKKCCGEHPKGRPIMSRLITVNLSDSEKFKKHLNVDIAPGKKLCSNCMSKYNVDCKSKASLTLKKKSLSASTKSDSQNSTSSDRRPFLTPEEDVIEYLNPFLNNLQ